ncbi:hypothetical protein EGY07_19360 [Chryseobacterium indologenes]|uniref:Uncharacterized protein n=1 Tax=Chryseobacterium indologenes TaxID=253 RepID=A0AAD0Z1P6_CHRID|nr:MULTISPECIES: hypothetical protein [Chryseobacterium]ATN07534.1 hypothetical protein CRN76_20115 [Chryseobacterium indologenes]AYY83727.1 hypothetical protein EGX91_03710 [Chryseobacterium indologenes]AYZ37545.1 hypothetical protein EGY07_19360 [Chryseobacterium indologenes]AZB19254.1 hypothetical protein EG352_16465 [Chryseobacterium indologenes]MBF6646417.1 hypothetical protein [Chryseobacterium indologenes]
MRKIIFCCAAGFLSFYAHAQVGIGTTKPKSVLDVNGKTTLRKELRVGGTSTQAGSAGLNGQVLVSQGEGKAPVWKSLNVSFMEEGQYKLINSYLSSDQIGIASLSNGVAGDNVYKNSVGDDITDATKGKWAKIGGLETTFTIKNGRNRLTYQFQTGVEMKAPTSTISDNVRFACGVFRNGKLVAVRPDRVASNNNSEKGGLQDYIFTLNYTELNVPVGVQKLEIACRKITTSNSGSQFAIGRDVASSNGASNAFTLESTMKIDVIEYVTYKSN